GDQATAGAPSAHLPSPHRALSGHRRAPGRHRRHVRAMAPPPQAPEPSVPEPHPAPRALRLRGAAPCPLLGVFGTRPLARLARHATPPPPLIIRRPRQHGRNRPPRRTARMRTHKAHRSRTAALIALLSILFIVLAVGAGLGAAGLLGGPPPTSDGEASDGPEPDEAAGQDSEATDPADTPEATDPADTPEDEDAAPTDE